MEFKKEPTDLKIKEEQLLAELEDAQATFDGELVGKLEDQLQTTRLKMQQQETNTDAGNSVQSSHEEEKGEADFKKEKEIFVADSIEFLGDLKQKYSEILNKKFHYWLKGGANVKGEHFFMPLEPTSPRDIELDDQTKLSAIHTFVSRNSSLGENLELVTIGDEASTGLSFGEWLSRFENMVNNFEQRNKRNS